MQNTSLVMFHLIPSDVKMSMNFWSCRRIFKAFIFPSPANMLRVSHPVHGWTPINAAHTSLPSAAASFVMSTSLTDDLDPRLMNILTFAPLLNPRQMMKTSVSSEMQTSSRKFPAMFLASNSMHVSASYWLDWRSSISCQPSAVNLTHLLPDVTNMLLFPSFALIFCSFQISAKNRSRLQFLILWPGIILLNAVPFWNHVECVQQM